MRADTVMYAAQPGLEMGEYEMDDGQKVFRDVHVAALRDGGMKVSAFPERCIATPVVGNNGSATALSIKPTSDVALRFDTTERRKRPA